MSVRTAKTIRTPAQVRDEFTRKGVSISSWAVAHGFSTALVFDLLAGRKKGLRGDAHRAAVALGLKRGEIVTDLSQVL